MTVRLESSHRFVVDVVAQAEDVSDSEAIRRIIERYARLVVDVPEGHEDPDVEYPTLWQEARDAARAERDLDLHWVDVHGDRAA